MQNIEQEYHANIDKFSQGIIIAQLELLLNYSRGLIKGASTYIIMMLPMNTATHPKTSSNKWSDTIFSFRDPPFRSFSTAAPFTTIPRIAR